MADQGLSEASLSLLGQQPMHSSTPIKGKHKAVSHQHSSRGRHVHSQHFHDSVQTIDTQPGSSHGSPQTGAVHTSLTPASLLHQQQHMQQHSKSLHHEISSHQSQHHHQPLQDDVNIRMQDERTRSQRSDVTIHHQELSLTQVAQHLESDTIQKQRRELQLLIEELKGRDRELNAMVTHHQSQLQAWELDRRRILMLEQRCAKLQNSLQTKTNEMAEMVGRLSLLESEQHSRHHVIENTQQQLSMLSEQHSHATHHIQQLEEQNRSLNDSIKESRTNMEQLETKEKKLSEALKAKERSIQEASVEISELKSKLKTSEQQLTELSVKETEARKIVEDWKERYTQRGLELDQVQEELSKSQASVDDLQTQLKRATTELKNYQLEKEIADEREQRKDELIALQRSKQERMEAELGSLRQLHERQQRDLSLLHLNLESSKDLLARQAAVYAEKSSVTSISMTRSSQDQTREDSNLQSLSPILKQPEVIPSGRGHLVNHTGQGSTCPEGGGNNGLSYRNGEEVKSMKVSETQDSVISMGSLIQVNTQEMKHGENSSDASRNLDKSPRNQNTSEKCTKPGVDKQSLKFNTGKSSQCVLSPSKTRAGPSSHAVTKTKTSPVKTRTQGNAGAKKGAVGKTLSKSSGRQSTPRKIAVSSQLKVPDDVEGIQSSPALLHSELLADCNTDTDKSCTSLKMTQQQQQQQQQSMMTGSAAEVNHAGTKGQVQHGKKSVYGSPKTLVQLYTDLNDSVRESVQGPGGADAKQLHSPQKEHINPNRDQLCKKLFDDDQDSGENNKMVNVYDNNNGANDALDEEEFQQQISGRSQCDAVLSSLYMYNQAVPSTALYTRTTHASSASSSSSTATTSNGQTQFVLKEKLNSPVRHGQGLDGFRLEYSAPHFAVNNYPNSVPETSQNHVTQSSLSDGYTAISQNHQQRPSVVQGQFEKHLKEQNINLQREYMLNANLKTSDEQVTEKGQCHMLPKGQGHILSKGQGQVLSDSQGQTSEVKKPANTVSASFTSAGANFDMTHIGPEGIQMMHACPGSAPLVHQAGPLVLERHVSEGGQTVNHQVREVQSMQQRNQVLKALLEYQASVQRGQTGDVDRSTTPHDHNLQDNEVEPSPLGKLHQLLTESKQMVQDMGSSAVPKYFSSA